MRWHALQPHHRHNVDVRHNGVRKPVNKTRQPAVPRPLPKSHPIIPPDNAQPSSKQQQTWRKKLPFRVQRTSSGRLFAKPHNVVVWQNGGVAPQPPLHRPLPDAKQLVPHLLLVRRHPYRGVPNKHAQPRLLRQLNAGLNHVLLDLLTATRRQRRKPTVDQPVPKRNAQPSPHQHPRPPPQLRVKPAHRLLLLLPVNEPALKLRQPPLHKLVPQRQLTHFPPLRRPPAQPKPLRLLLRHAGQNRQKLQLTRLPHPQHDDALLPTQPRRPLKQQPAATPPLVRAPPVVPFPLLHKQVPNEQHSPPSPPADFPKPLPQT